jgi:hypothetical protein
MSVEPGPLVRTLSTKVKFWTIYFLKHAQPSPKNKQTIFFSQRKMIQASHTFIESVTFVERVLTKGPG